MNISQQTAKALKYISLLYTEAAVSGELGSSFELAEEYVSSHIKSENDSDETLMACIAIVRTMLADNPLEPMDKGSYEQSLILAFPQSPNVVGATLVDFPDTEDGRDKSKGKIINIRRELARLDKIEATKKILMRATMQYTKEFDKIPDLEEFTSDLLQDIEDNSPTKKGEDAISDVIDFSDRKAVVEIIEKAKESNTTKGLWNTGFQGMNLMTSGGLRSGQMTIINALQHNYKTSLSVSLFGTLTTLNEPKDLGRAGKPTNVWLSMEDPVQTVMAFLYKFLSTEHGGTPPNIAEIDPEVVADYVIDKMMSTGFNIIIMKIDPSDFGYKALFNTLTEIELSGNHIQVLGIDYISTMSKIGCSKDGATGTDLRELYRRIRNYAEGKDILLISPHQLSPAARELLKQGVPAAQLVERTVNKGYTADSSQLTQEIDLEMTIHIFAHKGKDYLSVGRGKHRGQVISEKKFLWYCMEMPLNGGAIATDIDEDIPRCFHSVKEIDSAGGGDSDDFNIF